MPKADGTPTTAEVNDYEFEKVRRLEAKDRLMTALATELEKKEQTNGHEKNGHRKSPHPEIIVPPRQVKGPKGGHVTPWTKGFDIRRLLKKRGMGVATREVRDIARQIVTDPQYRRLLEIRLRIGDAPHMETLLWQYAYGKPKKNIDQAGTPAKRILADLRDLNVDQLKFLRTILGNMQVEEFPESDDAGDKDEAPEAP